MSCEEKSNPQLDIDNFTKIYDNSQFNVSYYPIDIQQTDDGGYLILGERKLYDSAFRLTYLMKVDKFGSFVKEIEVDETFVNPVGKLTKIDNNYYFFCMDANTQTYLASIDQDLNGGVTTNAVGNLSYPAASSFSDNEFVLLSYNDVDKQSVISVVDNTGNIQKSKSFSIGIGKGVEVPIINHFIHTGKQLPFTTGSIPGGLYYFNGYYNYTFSLVFTNFPSGDDAEPNGVVQGQQENGGFSAVASLGGANFAGARFNFGSNYIMPKLSLSINGLSSSTDLKGNTLPELVADAPVKIIHLTADTKNILVYASDTKAKQIGLYFYDETTGAFISSRYLGFSNPFEIANIIATADGGLAVCGTTYVAGRFPRICIFKLSKSQLGENINR
jgi:hypothetical protein